MTTALVSSPAHLTKPVPVQDRTVVLKSCYGKTGIKMFLEPCRDGRTGRWLGVEALSEEQKRGREYVVVPGVTRLEIQDGYTFDLRDPRQAIDWAWVQHCPQIVGGRNEASYHGISAEESRSFEGADNEFYVFDEAAETANQEQRFDKQYQALQVIHELKGHSAYYQFARLLGSNMETSSVSAVRTFLQDQAQRFPQRVMAAKQDASSSVKLFLYAALDKEIIRKRQGVFYYNDIALGSTEEQTLFWLGEDRNFTLVRAMQLELYPSKQAAPRQISQANQQLFEQSQQVVGNDAQLDAASVADGSDFEVEGEEEDLDTNDPTREQDSEKPLTRAEQLRLAREAKKNGGQSV